MCDDKRQVIQTEKAPKAIGPYSQGVKAGCLFFISGQLGLIPESGEFIQGGIEAQTKQSLINLKNILESQGYELGDVVKTIVFLKDMRDFPKMNAIYAEFFKLEPPARSTVEVADLPKGGLVEIEAIAFKV